MGTIVGNLVDQGALGTVNKIHQCQTNVFDMGKVNFTKDPSNDSQAMTNLNNNVMNDIVTISDSEKVNSDSSVGTLQ